ncbi:chromosome segregation protein SMC, partial [Streptococcus pyogenes]
LRESYVRLMQTEAEKSNQLTKLEQEWDHQNRQSESKAKEIEKLESDKLETEKDLVASQAKLSEAEGQLRGLLDDYKTSQSDLNQAQEAYQLQQNKMFDLLDAIKEKKARQNSLESIMKNHSNF